MRFSKALGSALVVLIATLLGTSVPAYAAGPSVAVFTFTTLDLTSNWWGNFEPGIALSDLITDQLANAGKFDVLDRKNLDSVLEEHHLSGSGEDSPASLVQSGRLIGAKFLVTGNVLQFDRTDQSGGASGVVMPDLAGAALGGPPSTRITLKVQVHVIDAQSGQIVQSFAEEQTQKGTSWGAGGYSGNVAGGYGNSQFVNSAMGHLINDEAIEIAAKIDPLKLGSTPLTPALRGLIISVDEGNIVLNIGSSSGVSTGMYFDVVKIKQIKDPSSGKVLTANLNAGKIQIVSVSDETAVGKPISGDPALNEVVQAEP
ncbi:MAG TPA: CsgG/HfaB family protein [Candidatus Baltobacteraceae bacterium]|nr:CsgG/HfaB family protein [Candidatus Baltobacteraceae bacterium]